MKSDEKRSVSSEDIHLLSHLMALWVFYHVNISWEFALIQTNCLQLGCIRLSEVCFAHWCDMTMSYDDRGFLNTSMINNWFMQRVDLALEQPWRSANMQKTGRILFLLDEANLYETEVAFLWPGLPLYKTKKLDKTKSVIEQTLITENVAISISHTFFRIFFYVTLCSPSFFFSWTVLLPDFQLFKFHPILLINWVSGCFNVMDHREEHGFNSHKLYQWLAFNNWTLLYITM